MVLTQERAQILKNQLPDLLPYFEQQSPEVLLRWVIENFESQFVLACAFGPESIILIDMLSRLQPEVKAFFLDTDFHFAQTLALKNEMEARYPTLRLEVVSPLLNVAELEEQYGAELYRRNPDQCCALRKVEPLNRTLKNYDCWISGLRREQSHTRTLAPMLQWDWQRDMFKVNPLVHWTKSQVWQYILDHNLPYNPLHDQGYPSIGCEPCTKAAVPGAEERSGRWQGTQKVECGLHL